MLQALSEVILDFFPLSQRYEMPSFAPLSRHAYQERWGASEASKLLQVSGNESVLGPSWVVFLESTLDGKTLYDKQLPLEYVIVCHDTYTAENVKRKMPWYDRLMVKHSLHVIIVTGSSLEADSRKNQLNWMDQLLSKLQSLSMSSRLSLQWRPAEDLELAEASRLVLVGQPPTGGSLELASLSNLLDYSSSGIMHGSSIGGKQRVHVLLGHVYLDRILAFLVQAGADETGVSVSFGHHKLLRNKLPYIQKVQKGKGGRPIVTNLDSRSNPPPEKPLSIGEVGSRRPTRDEIKLESLTCPFGFLPFYHDS
jgi:hypothetical protein